MRQPPHRLLGIGLDVGHIGVDHLVENLVLGLAQTVGLTPISRTALDCAAPPVITAAPPPPEIRDAIKSGRFDAVLFTSSSTVRNLVGIAGKPHASTVIACIGPATAKTAEECGLRVDVLAPEPSADDVLRRINGYETASGSIVRSLLSSQQPTARCSRVAMAISSSIQRRPG